MFSTFKTSGQTAWTFRDFEPSADLVPAWFSMVPSVFIWVSVWLCAFSAFDISDKWLKKHPLKKSAGLADMERQFQGVLRDCGAHVTANYAVDDLCSSFPARLRDLVAAKGGRLNH